MIKNVYERGCAKSFKCIFVSKLLIWVAFLYTSFIYNKKWSPYIAFLDLPIHGHNALMCLQISVAWFMFGHYHNVLSVDQIRWICDIEWMFMPCAGTEGFIVSLSKYAKFRGFLNYLKWNIPKYLRWISLKSMKTFELKETETCFSSYEEVNDWNIFKSSHSFFCQKFGELFPQ